MTDQLDFLIRAWAPPAKPSKRRNPAEQPEAQMPSLILVFDTETTTDDRQALTFGCWRYYRVTDGRLECFDEGLFHADDLAATNPAGLRILRRYVTERQADTTNTGRRPIRLFSRAEFTRKVFHPAAYKARAAVVGFNLPFDLSRLAVGVGDSRSGDMGGFSFILHQGRDGHSEQKHRPRVIIKNSDGPHSVMKFAKRHGPDLDDLYRPDGEFDKNYGWPGIFVDLRTLVFSLTGETLSLAAACDRFLTGQRKTAPEGHGRISASYIDYCRQDVASTASLYEVAAAEFDRHPVNLAIDKSFSPASLAKAYLDAQGITPPLTQNPSFSPQILGWSMTAFHGGRSECRIRKQPVPVTLVDFTSMYPTVDSLLGLWGLLTARRITAVDATAEVATLLDTVTLDDCFEPALWSEFVGIARVRPDGDILPTRALFDNKSPNTAVGPLTSTEPLWFTIPDLVASTLLTGKPPQVTEAIRFVGEGTQTGLAPVALRGTVTVDPTVDDFIRFVVEQRQRTLRDDTLPVTEAARLSAFLKVVANAGSYGIHCELNRKTLPKKQHARVQVHGRFDEPFAATVTAPEEPGRWCFPPFAAVITGAGRLMLAMLERTVTDHDGTWVFCDTDSMAIVANTHGSPISQPEHLPVPALTYHQVDQIRARFDQLNPYDRTAVPHLLKEETRAYCYAIAAKRYALYTLDPNTGRPVLEKTSEHGLGHLLNPDPTGDDPGWIAQFWQHTLNQVHAMSTRRPDWYDLPVVARSTITTPDLHQAFRHVNAGLRYVDQIKPFNFVTVVPSAKPPPGTDPARFRLIAPYQPDPGHWTALRAINLHQPGHLPYGITTNWGEPDLAAVDTFEDHLNKHLNRPEHKALAPHGGPCDRTTTGQLQRRAVTPRTITHIGKETNRLTDRTTGLVDPADLRSDYGVGPGDLQLDTLLQQLRDTGTKMVAAGTGISRRQLDRYLVGTHRPHSRNRTRLTAYLAAIGPP